jgi:hypothetical protein
MGEASCTYWGNERYNTGFCWEYLKEIDHLEDLYVDGRIISIYILKKYNGGID